MKKTSILSVAILIFSVFSFQTLLAQSPEALYYQAEARDSKGHTLCNKNLEVKITILADNPNGTVYWEGYHHISTDNFGMFSLIIGEGIGGSYNFSAIDWANRSHFLNVQVYYKNSWSDMGTTQFLSVPYALHANVATDAIHVDDADADPTNEFQMLSLDDYTLSLTDGNSVELPVPTAQPMVPILFVAACTRDGALGKDIYCLDQKIINTAEDYVNPDSKGKVQILKSGYYNVKANSLSYNSNGSTTVLLKVGNEIVSHNVFAGYPYATCFIDQICQLNAGDIVEVEYRNSSYRSFYRWEPGRPYSLFQLQYLGPLQ